MAIPDISTLAPAELIQLINSANARYAAQQQAEADTEQQLRADIGQAVATLDALIGDGTTTPNLSTIVGVQLYTDAQIGANSVLAIRLLMQGLEVTARTLRDVARVAGNS